MDFFFASGPSKFIADNASCVIQIYCKTSCVTSDYLFQEPREFFQSIGPLGRCFEVVSHLNILVWKWSKIAAQKKVNFCADFALQNMLETKLPDGLETSGRRVYR